MDPFRAAERALVAAVVLGEADPAELAGRLDVSDFTDPAAALVFQAALRGRSAGSRGFGSELPAVLRAEGVLRGDGYPLREVVGWLPQVPVPAHPQAWAGLLVAGSLARLVQGCGTRLIQASEHAAAGRGAGGAGRVLAVAVAQQAAVRSGLRRWSSLPVSWRAAPPICQAVAPVPADLTLPGEVSSLIATRDATSANTATTGATSVEAATTGATTAATNTPADGADRAGRAGRSEERSAAPPVPTEHRLVDVARLERELLGAVVAAPVLLDRIGWLQPEDMADPRHGQVLTVLRELRRAGRPVDLITLTAALTARTALDSRVDGQPARGDGSVDAGWAGLDPAAANPASAVVAARQLLTGSVLHAAHRTGLQLHELGSTPAAVGFGGPMLQAASARLTTLTEHGRRWQRAHVRPDRPALTAGRAAARPGLAALPASAGRTGPPGPGGTGDRPGSRGAARRVSGRGVG